MVLKYKAFAFLPWSLSQIAMVFLHLLFNVILSNEKLKMESISVF